MAYSRDKFVKKMQSYVGLKESDGSHMKIVNTYNSYKPLARGYKLKSSDSWCAATISSAAIECGYTAIIPTEVSCPQMIELFKKLGEWQENDAYKPSAGDIVFYDWQDSGSGDNKGTPDHVGCVEKVSGNTITVIEGNKNDAVGRRSLQVNGKYIRGYGVPKYDGTSASSNTSKPSSSASSSTNTGKSTNWTGYVNTPSGVNVRSTPEETKTNKITAISNGTKVQITRESGSWGFDSISGGWVSLKYIKKGSSGSSSGASSSKPSYKVGTTYTLSADHLTVRTGAGTNYKAKAYSQLTANAKQNAYKDGTLKKGTRVTCQATKKVGADIWMKIPSGWCAAYYDGKKYIK